MTSFRASDATSVFTDDSGARRRLLMWTVRGLIAAIVLSAAAVTFSLAAHVPLPDLPGPFSLPGSSSTERQATDTPDEDGASPDPDESTLADPTPTATPSAGTSKRPAATTTRGPGAPGSKPSSAPTTPSTSTPPAPTPTKTPGSKANHGAASTDAPRGNPTKNPSGPDKTPPGKLK